MAKWWLPWCPWSARFSWQPPPGLRLSSPATACVSLRAVVGSYHRDRGSPLWRTASTPTCPSFPSWAWSFLSLGLFLLASSRSQRKVRQRSKKAKRRESQTTLGGESGEAGLFRDRMRPAGTRDLKDLLTSPARAPRTAVGSTHLARTRHGLAWSWRCSRARFLSNDFFLLLWQT